MDELLLPERVRLAYQASVHKARMDERAAALLAEGYTGGMVVRHIYRWLPFVRLFEAPGTALPASASEPTVLTYLERHRWRSKDGRTRMLRSIRLLLQQDGTAGRRPGQESPLYVRHVPGYLDFACQHRGVRAPRPIENWLRSFLGWLDAREVSDLGALRIADIREYFDDRRHLRRSTLATGVSAVRGFLRYLYLRGHVALNLAAAMESPRLYRMSEPPPVIDTDTIARLLAAVDRSTSIGKRDAAMLLLAARYGLRPSDIRGLRIDDIHWRDQRIALVQAKTQRPLELPLIGDVDDALVDYLRHGRPKCAAREVFVRHTPPVAPLSPCNNLWNVMDRAFRSARLELPPRHRGLYLLRHSAATRMLAQGVSFDTISDVLGHASVEATRVYAKVDLVGLRSVALDLAEVER